MEPCQITQVHRPPRLGFVIPYDKDKIVEYIKCISASAGGIYHFIFPYKDGADFKKWKKYLRPGLQDYIFHDEKISEKDQIQWRKWPGFDKEFVLEYKDYPESYLSFIDVAPFHGEWRYLPEPQKDKTNLIYLEDVNLNNLFPFFLFGDLPQHLSFPFHESWKQIGAKSHKFDWEEYLNPFGKPRITGPLQFSRIFLRTRGNLDSEGIFYIGNPEHLDDLLEFWNLRALGHKVLFLPTHLIGESYLDYEKWDDYLTPRYKYVKPEMEDWYRPHIIFGAEYYNDKDKQKEITGELKKRLGKSIRTTQPVFKYNSHDLYPRAKFVYFSDDRYSGYDSAKEIKTISKSPFPNHDFPFNQKWLMNFSTASLLDRECHPTKLPELSIESENNLFKGSYYRSDHIHISNGGLSIVGQFDNHEFHIPKIDILQIISAIADSQGYNVNLSKPGNNVSLIIKTLGELQSDGRILKIQGVRDVIKTANRDRFIESDLEELLTEEPPDSGKLIDAGNLNNNSLRGYLKKILSRYHEKIINEEFTGIKSDKALDLIEAGMADTNKMCIAPYKQADSQKFILERMVAQNILELGFNFECVRKHTCWYPINKLSESIECRICGEEKKIVDPRKTIQWAYQTKGMFRLKNDADGSISVVVSLWRLIHSLHNATFTPSVDVKKKKSKDSSLEVDYIVYLENWGQDEPKLILGEAKSLNSLAKSDMDTMSKALKVFTELKPAVCFSTLKDKFSASEVDLIKEFRKKHPYIEILTFVRKQLGVYDLHECGISESLIKSLAPELYRINVDHKYWLDPGEIKEK